MKASKRAFELIKGSRVLSLEPFFNYKGKKVIGYEEPYTIVQRERITRKQAESQLLESIRLKSKALTEFLKKADCYPITQNQFDALVSLSYDVSLTVIALSGLFHDLHKENYISAQAKFRIWSRYKKQPVYRLIKARKMEIELFKDSFS